MFFSFPHIGVDTDGTVGKVKRPGREGNSAACGALVAALGELQGGGLEPLLLPDGGALAMQLHDWRARRAPVLPLLR